jgi:hypothetical protein
MTRQVAESIPINITLEALLFLCRFCESRLFTTIT